MWSKMWVMEKKCSQSDIHRISIITPRHIGPLKFQHILKTEMQKVWTHKQYLCSFFLSWVIRNLPHVTNVPTWPLFFMLNYILYLQVTSWINCLMWPMLLQDQFSKHRPSGPMLSISQNVRLCVRVFVCVFTFEVPFIRLFSPTSRSSMSDIFGDSESLGTSNGKKWSQIGTFLFENCQKALRNFFLLFLLILPYKTWWKPRFPMD